MNAITAIPPKLANRLKDRFRAEIVAKCKAQHFEECRRNNKAVIEKELERMAKEHAEKLESQRIKAEKAIQEALGERVNELKTIRKLEQAKKVIESEAEMKDQQIRNLQADLQKSMVTEANLKNSNATAEIAVRKAQADLKPQENQIPNQRTAKEALKNAAKGITDLRAKNAVLKNAAKEITDLRAENAVLKKQIGEVKGDLKVSTKKVEVLEVILIQPPPPTKASHKTKSIRNLKSSVEQLTSIVAEQAQTLANINSTMIDFKNANETLVKELARQRSERAAAEDKAAGLLEMFYAERQAKEDLEKKIGIQAADYLNQMAAAPTEAVPTTESSTTAIIVQDKSPTLGNSNSSDLTHGISIYKPGSPRFLRQPCPAGILSPLWQPLPHLQPLSRHPPRHPILPLHLLPYFSYRHLIGGGSCRGYKYRQDNREDAWWLGMVGRGLSLEDFCFGPELGAGALFLNSDNFVLAEKGELVGLSGYFSKGRGTGLFGASRWII